LTAGVARTHREADHAAIVRFGGSRFVGRWSLRDRLDVRPETYYRVILLVPSAAVGGRGSTDGRSGFGVGGIAAVGEHEAERVTGRVDVDPEGLTWLHVGLASAQGEHLLLADVEIGDVEVEV
jgi:hypothetical protein